MRRYGTYIHLFCFFVALLTLSCGKEEGMREPETDKVPISLSTPGFTDATKGMDPLQDNTLNNFGICAVFNYDGVSENQWYLSRHSVVRDPVTDKFILNPTSYWPVFGDLSFFSYAPKFYNERTQEEIPFVETVTGFPKVEFTPSTEDIANQIDFCIGRPVMHYTRKDNPVPVTFEHTLTQIIFYANYTGVIPKGFFMLITELRIKNVVGTKSVSYSTYEPYFVWEDEAGRQADSTYVLEMDKNHIKRDSIRRSTGLVPDIYQGLTNSPGRLYLLPQTLGPDAMLEVKYGFYYDYGASPKPVALFIKEIPLPQEQIWPGGKTVNYKVTVDVGVSSPLKLDCSITDWVPSGNSHTEYEFE